MNVLTCVSYTARLVRMFWSAAIVGAAIGVSSCAFGDRAGVEAALDKMLAATSTKPALAARLCGPPNAARCAGRVNEVWTDVQNFYKQRGGEPVWVNGRTPGSAAKIALGAFARAAEHGLDPEAYGAASLKAELERLKDPPPTGSKPEDLAKFEAELTTALLALGRDVAMGRAGAPPPGIGAERRRKVPDIAARFGAVLDEGDFTAWPDEMRPAHPQYAALQKAMAAMLSAKATAPADTTVSASPMPMPLPTTGGRRGTRAMGEADQKRLLALNMDRWRWMPDDLGDRYVMVNVPQFHLYVFEGNRPALESRVIVGKLGDETPIFSATMSHVIFSPYWNIPESIAEGETVPAIVRNPEYLAKNQIEVLRRAGGTVERVDPSTVDWNNPSETADLSLRQRPGPGNALGHVKFMFPNRYSVYLHDTPTDNLFERAGRAFSHGCVRVAEPVALAKYVLADDPVWTEEAIEKAMKSGDERTVKLKRPLPVHIVYFTAWADQAGHVTYLDDVYRRDR